jgi:hypothetical protein
MPGEQAETTIENDDRTHGKKVVNSQSINDLHTESGNRSSPERTHWRPVEAGL